VLLGSFGKIPALLAIGDCFVFPTYYEGLPGALIEAMMAGKIIIAAIS
jgi:glycosyltransferase involved in cell wall biosynthesis